MKNTTIKITTLLVAVAMIFASCSKDSASSSSIDETMLYGKWQSIHHIINGQTYDFDVMIEIISDGTGVIETTEISNPVPFTWSLSGNSLKITASNNTAKFKIEDLTDTQIIISGNSFPGVPNINLTSYKGTYKKVVE